MNINKKLCDLEKIMHEKNVPDADAKRTIEILKLCEVESFAVKRHINAPILATPENHNREGIVRVTAVSDVVCVYYRKDNDFIKIVKNLCFSWNFDSTRWQRKISFRTGSAENLCAEVGNNLLVAGFTVSFDNNAIKDKAIKADYTPTHKKWVYVLEDYDGYFIFDFRHDPDNDWYKVVKSIPGAQYDCKIKHVKVPEKYYLEILDFAEQNSFKLSPGAEERINILENSLDVILKSQREENPVIEFKITDGILEDLIDD